MRVSWLFGLNHSSTDASGKINIQHAKKNALKFNAMVNNYSFVQIGLQLFGPME